jgi:hypothetical protein
MEFPLSFLLDKLKKQHVGLSSAYHFGVVNLCTFPVIKFNPLVGAIQTVADVMAVGGLLSNMLNNRKESVPPVGPLRARSLEDAQLEHRRNVLILNRQNIRKSDMLLLLDEVVGVDEAVEGNHEDVGQLFEQLLP